MPGSNLKILMITSEVVPFAKAGGLGDMVGALSAELSRQGHDVRIVLPRYYSIDTGRMQRIGGPLGVPLRRPSLSADGRPVAIAGCLRN